MSLRIDSKTETELETDETSGQEDLTRDDKLRRIKDKKFELERHTGRGAPDLEALEARIASVDIPKLRDNNG